MVGLAKLMPGKSVKKWGCKTGVKNEVVSVHRRENEILNSPLL